MGAYLIGNNNGIYTFKVNLSDKYGDYGLVGSMIVSAKGEDMVVESFMLSCRALNRNVEKEMLYHLVNFARNSRIRNIIIPFIQTSRNLPAKMFLETLNADTKISSDGTTVFTIAVNTDNLFLSTPSIKQQAYKVTQPNQSKKSDLMIGRDTMFELLDLTTANIPARKADQPNTKPGIKNVSRSLNCIWNDILQVNSIKESDNFFHLGGDSLSALRLLSQVCECFNIDINLYEIFEHPTFRDLINLINIKLSSCHGIDKYRLPALIRQTNKDTYDLAYNQKSLWLLDKLYNSSWFYNISSTHSIRGNINISALESAIRSIITKNNIFKSSLAIENLKPKLVINTDGPTNFEVVHAQDLSEYELGELISYIQLQPFNLYEQPLYRIKLLKRSESHHVLVLVFHHIIFDGWSEGLFNKQLQFYYQQYLSGNSSQQISSEYEYTDFIAWQKSLYKTDYYEKCISYWANELEGFVPLRFSVSQLKSTDRQHHGKYHYFKIPDQLYGVLTKSPENVPKPCFFSVIPLQLL